MEEQVTLRRRRGDAAALLAKELDVHDLALDARRQALLGAMDRLLALSRSAPGATVTALLSLV
jgi:hypothetical protein